MFLINVPVGLAGIALAPFLVSESRDSTAPPRLDVAGAVSVTAGLTLLVYGITRVQEVGPLAPATLASLGFSVVLLVVFVVLERRVRRPLVPPGIFRSRPLLGATLVALALTAATPPMLLCTLYVQRVLVFPPFNLAVIGGSLLGPRLVRRAGARATMVCGLLAIAAGSACLLGIGAQGGGYLLYMVLSHGLGPGMRLGSVYDPGDRGDGRRFAGACLRPAQLGGPDRDRARARDPGPPLRRVFRGARGNGARWGCPRWRFQAGVLGRRRNRRCGVVISMLLTGRNSPKK